MLTYQQALKEIVRLKAQLEVLNNKNRKLQKQNKKLKNELKNTSIS